MAAWMVSGDQRSLPIPYFPTDYHPPGSRPAGGGQAAVPPVNEFIFSMNIRYNLDIIRNSGK